MSPVVSKWESIGAETSLVEGVPGITEDGGGGQCGCAAGSRWESQGGIHEDGWSRRQGPTGPTDHCWKVGLSSKWEPLQGRSQQRTPSAWGLC